MTAVTSFSFWTNRETVEFSTRLRIETVDEERAAFIEVPVDDKMNYSRILETTKNKAQRAIESVHTQNCLKWMQSPGTNESVILERFCYTLSGRKV